MVGEHRAAHLLPSVVELRRRATLTIIALGAVMLARGWSFGALEWSLVLLGSVPKDGSGAPPDLMDRLRAADGLVNDSGAAVAFTFVVTAVLFLRWVHRLVLLVRALGAPYRWEPAAAVWGFLIPFVSFVRPYQVLSSALAALEPDMVAPPDVRVEPSAQGDYRSVAFIEPSASRKLPQAPVAMWWGAFLVMSVGSRLATMATTPGKLDAIATNYQANMLLNAVAVLAAVLAVMVVRGLTARVVERFRRIRESTPESLDAQGIEIS